MLPSRSLYWSLANEGCEVAVCVCLTSFAFVFHFVANHRFLFFSPFAFNYIAAHVTGCYGTLGCHMLLGPGKALFWLAYVETSLSLILVA